MAPAPEDGRAPVELDQYESGTEVVLRSAVAQDQARWIVASLLPVAERAGRTRVRYRQDEHQTDDDDREPDGGGREVLETYNVGAFYADPHEWQDELAGWEGDFGGRVRVNAPGAGGPFTWWPQERAMTAAIEAFYGAIVNGALSHDGHPVLRRHLLGAHRYPTRYGFSVRKEHPTSARKIDGLVAAAQAWVARLALVAAGPAKKRSGVVW